MYWDLLDWYLVIIFIVQLWFQYMFYRICIEIEIRKFIRRILKHYHDNLAEMEYIIYVVGILEIIIFLLLLFYRYLKN